MGPSAASSVQVDDPTPTDLTFQSNAGDCTTTFPCSLGAIPAGQTRTITATFNVPLSYPAPVPIANSATVASATGDPDSGNNTAVAISRFGLFFTLTPCRLADTRFADNPALQPGQERTFILSGSCEIPAGATAVAVNVTVTQGAAPGNLRLFPADVAMPLVSTINWSPGQTRANNAIVVGSADGTVAIIVKNSSAGSVHFVLDVSGYFQ